jgi:extracellular matrix protein 14
MRHSFNALPFLFILLLTPLSCAVPSDSAFPNAQQYRQPATQRPAKLRNVFPQLTWLRDTAIEKVFGVPPKSKQLQGNQPVPPLRSSNTQLPATLRAKYGGDVVLRFNISTWEEEAALSEAADTLFLDVWEFADNWADIRLREDDVRALPRVY